jgi:thiol-disulfide isomerase/thioredoxin
MKKTAYSSLFVLFLLALATPSVSAQANKAKSKTPNTVAKAADWSTVTVRCRFDNCSAVDTMTLWLPDGLVAKPLKSAKRNTAGEFVFEIPRSATPQYFSLTMNADVARSRYLLLGTEREVLLTGACHDVTQTTIQGSAINDSYADAQKKMNATKIEMGKIMQTYNRDYYTESIRLKCEQQMLEVDKRKLAILDSFKQVNPVVARALALDTYTSFQNSSKKLTVKSEIDYFATQYFQYVNWSDPAFNETPQIFEAFRNWASVLLLPDLKLARPQIRDYFNAALQSLPAKSKAYKFALTGITSVLMQQQHPLIADFGDRYLNEYPDDDMNMRANVNQFVSHMRANQVDVPAPEIVQADSTGQMRKLSDLKGKVVLIDFWASWCGPCRKENPTVVAAYKKYQAKGFEVFSVSLDKDRDRWLAAIQQDNLIWPNHVSDLKFWQNEAAQKYGVTSIPRTILLDKNGLITDHNLRGEALEKRLKEIFGE